MIGGWIRMMDKIELMAKGIFESSKGSHDWDHTMRVYNLCTRIGRKEDADLEILGIASLLHDIGRQEQDRSKGRICHAEVGAQMAEKMLMDMGVDDQKVDKIVHCIRCHRFRGKNIPVSKEAMILFDADKLDSIGAVGIGRAFLFAGEVGARLHNPEVDIANTESYSKEDTAYREFSLKLKKIKERMFTQEARRIAQDRHDFMVDFFDRLNNEVDGHI